MRREYDGAVVAVSSALDHLVIITLLRSNVAEAGTATCDVGDDARQLGTRHVADAFLHEADAGAAGCRHAANAGRRGAVEHVDGGYFAFGLQEDSADLGM